MIRLDKYLADCGIGTRSEVKKYIKGGRIRINSTVANDSSMKINEQSDAVYFDEHLIEYEENLYFMLNKPAGCVSATKDSLSETVLGFLANENTKNLFPVGRLDKDTEGLLLITDDGQLAHDLLSPKKHVDKMYYAEVTKALTLAEMEQFAEGIDIGDDKITLPADIVSVALDQATPLPGGNCTTAINFAPSPGGNCATAINFAPSPANLSASFPNTDDEPEVSNKPSPVAAYYVTLREGRYHQVKRMFEHFDSTVTYLKRISMGNLKLDDSLRPGEYKKLTKKEIDEIR